MFIGLSSKRAALRPLTVSAVSAWAPLLETLACVRLRCDRLVSAARAATPASPILGGGTVRTHSVSSLTSPTVIVSGPGQPREGPDADVANHVQLGSARSTAITLETASMCAQKI